MKSLLDCFESSTFKNNEKVYIALFVLQQLIERPKPSLITTPSPPSDDIPDPPSKAKIQQKKVVNKAKQGADLEKKAGGSSPTPRFQQPPSIKREKKTESSSSAPRFRKPAGISDLLERINRL